MKVAVQNPDGGPRWQIVRPPVPIRVFLNEKIVRRVVAVDDVAGEVWVHKTGPDGNLVVNKELQEIELERLTGKVEITFLRCEDQ